MFTVGSDKVEDVQVIVRFDKCPWCGSTERMMGKLGEEMKEAGLLSDSLEIGLSEVGGPIIDPSKVGQMLVESYRPGMFALRDICLGCGREITVKVERKQVKVDITKTIPQ